jgi:hypothetical protein
MQDASVRMNADYRKDLIGDDSIQLDFSCPSTDLYAHATENCHSLS